MSSTKTNRRGALKAGLSLLSLASVAAVATSARAQQSAKAAPATVAYQTKPSNGQQCSTCSQFVAPASCNLVAGAISPSGWCELYSPKS